jgi:hypothetical protein
MERWLLPNMERGVSEHGMEASPEYEAEAFPRKRRLSAGRTHLCGRKQFLENARPHDHVARLVIMTCVAFGVAVLSEHS